MNAWLAGSVATAGRRRQRVCRSDHDLRTPALWISTQGLDKQGGTFATGIDKVTAFESKRCQKRANEQIQTGGK